MTVSILAAKYGTSTERCLEAIKSTVIIDEVCRRIARPLLKVGRIADRRLGLSLIRYVV